MMFHVYDHFSLNMKKNMVLYMTIQKMEQPLQSS